LSGSGTIRTSNAGRASPGSRKRWLSQRAIPLRSASSSVTSAHRNWPFLAFGAPELLSGSRADSVLIEQRISQQRLAPQLASCVRGPIVSFSVSCRMRRGPGRKPRGSEVDQRKSDFRREIVFFTCSGRSSHVGLEPGCRPIAALISSTRVVNSAVICGDAGWRGYVLLLSASSWSRYLAKKSSCVLEGPMQRR